MDAEKNGSLGGANRKLCGLRDGSGSSAGTANQKARIMHVRYTMECMYHGERNYCRYNLIYV